jgi:hypothetical protein
MTCLKIFISTFPNSTPSVPVTIGQQVTGSAQEYGQVNNFLVGKAVEAIEELIKWRKENKNKP